VSEAHRHTEAVFRSPLNLFAFVLAFAIVSFQSFVPPVIGLADNGDFGKMIGRFALRAPAEYENAYATTKYTYDQSYWYLSGFWSSETLLLIPALWINGIVFRDGAFDIRAAGAVHAALFLLALYLILPLVSHLSKLRRIFILLLLLVVFEDVMYVSMLNSFYMDVAAFLFLLLAIVFYWRARRWQHPIDAILCLFCSVLLITAKTQHVLLGMLIAALFVWNAALMFPARPRLWATASAVTILACAVLSWKSTPPNYSATPNFNVIFYELLPHSQRVRQDLKELGLDASYERYSGTHTYSEGSPMKNPEFVRTFASRTSHARLAWFFVKHPARAWRAIRTGLNEAGRQLPYLGHYDKSAGLGVFAQSHTFEAWSRLKGKLFERHGTSYFWFFLALVVAVCAVAKFTQPPLFAEGLALSGMAALELLVASLADVLDVPRHYFLFNTLTDVLFVVLAISAVAGMPSLNGRQTEPGRTSSGLSEV
jgi:hypothetical protein